MVFTLPAHVGMNLWRKMKAFTILPFFSLLLSPVSLIIWRLEKSVKKRDEQGRNVVISGARPYSFDPHQIFKGIVATYQGKKAIKSTTVWGFWVQGIHTYTVYTVCLSIYLSVYMCICMYTTLHWVQYHTFLSSSYFTPISKIKNDCCLNLIIINSDAAKSYITYK